MAPKKSLTWEHFVDIGESEAQCKICKVILSCKSGVSNLLKHLRRKHKSYNLLRKEPDHQVVQAHTSQTAQNTSSTDFPTPRVVKHTPSSATAFLRLDGIKENTLKSNNDGSGIKSHDTRSAILPILARVYIFLEREYQYMKALNGDNCDLSPLADILKRTAEATGFGENDVIIGMEREGLADHLPDRARRKTKNCDYLCKLLGSKDDEVLRRDNLGVTVEKETTGNAGYGHEALSSVPTYVFLTSDTEQTPVKVDPKVNEHNFLRGTTIESNETMEENTDDSHEDRNKKMQMNDLSEDEKKKEEIRRKRRERNKRYRENKKNKLAIHVDEEKRETEKHKNREKAQRYREKKKNSGIKEATVSVTSDSFRQKNAEKCKRYRERKRMFQFQTQNISEDDEVLGRDNLDFTIGKETTEHAGYGHEALSSAPTFVFLTSDTEQTQVKVEPEDNEDVTSQSFLHGTTPLESNTAPTYVFLTSDTEQTQVKVEPEDNEEETSHNVLHEIPPLGSNDEYFNEDEDNKMDIEQYTFTGTLPNAAPNTTASVSEYTEIKIEPADDH